MPISSNSLIHLTDSREALEGILIDTFRVKYCKETIKFKEKRATIHVPMVSFCDIPLSQIKDHISSYGCYGIGLTRDWAVRNHLNPVLYVQNDSSLAHSYEQSLLYYEGDGAEDDSAVTAYRQLSDIARYIKNYEGILEREGHEPKLYRFSDEREWRFVPNIDHDCEMYYSAKEFKDESVKRAANKSVSKLRLAFEPNDIKYIIIKDESEINDFVNHLRSAKGANFTMREVEKLTTRILTSDQIATDF